MSSAVRNRNQFSVRMRPWPITCSELAPLETEQLAPSAGREHPAADHERGEEHAEEHLDDRGAVDGAQDQRDRAPDESGERDAGEAESRSRGSEAVSGVMMGSLADGADDASSRRLPSARVCYVPSETGVRWAGGERGQGTDLRLRRPRSSTPRRPWLTAVARGLRPARDSRFPTSCGAAWWARARTTTCSCASSSGSRGAPFDCREGRGREAPALGRAGRAPSSRCPASWTPWTTRRRSVSTLGIASSSSSWWVRGHLERLGLLGRFSVRVHQGGRAGDQAGPGDLRRDARRLGVEARGCGARSRTPAPGVAAAKGAGLRGGRGPGQLHRAHGLLGGGRRCWLRWAAVNSSGSCGASAARRAP